MNVKDLRPGLEKVDLRVRIVKLNDPRNVTTYSKLEHLLVDGEIEDATGRAMITVWDNAIQQLEGVGVNDLVELRNCLVTSFKRVLHVNVGRDSQVIKLSRGESVDSRRENA